jgi:hypothetical protein
MRIVIYSRIAMSSRATMKREKAKSTALEDSLCRQMRLADGSAVSKRRCFLSIQTAEMANVGICQ